MWWMERLCAKWVTTLRQTNLGWQSACYHPHSHHYSINRRYLVSHGEWRVSVFVPLCENVTSSTKQEVHNVLYYQRRIAPQPQVTRTANLVKFGNVIFEICQRPDRQTYKQVLPFSDPKMSRSKDLRTAEINHRRTHPVHLVLVNESIFTNEKCGKPVHPPVTTYIHTPFLTTLFQVKHGQHVAPLTLPLLK